MSDGDVKSIALQTPSVADFYAALVAALADLGIPVDIDDKRCEIAGANFYPHGARSRG